jgi:hypothetical protein
MGAMPRKKTRNHGVNALARIVGLTPMAISYKMDAGMTKEEILTEWRAKTGQPEPRKVEVNGRVVSGGYVPGRKPAAVIANPKISKPVEVLVDMGLVDDEESVESAPLNLRQAQARNQFALAQMHELELAEKRNELVVVSRYMKNFGDMVIRAREAFLRIPGELADRLAVETNPGKITRLLDDELRQVLDILTKPVETEEEMEMVNATN